ncbi:MAG: Magnesium and cobalt transport protein CorA [Actinomycetota bacterium]|nr:Magnesium and cobalt transport protein CorA [Actinomycetota bacterium]
MRQRASAVFTTIVIRGLGVYRDGARLDDAVYVRGELPGTPGLAEHLQELARIATREGQTFAWVGLSHPTKVELDLVGKVFGLDPLYLDDAMNAHQPTKLDPRDEYDFLVMKILTYVESTSDVETGQLSVFIGDSYIITVRLGPLGDLDDVRRDLEGRPEVLRFGPPAVLHAIMDHIVDGYLAVADEINTDIQILEEDIFSPRPSNPEAVYRLKRENLELRRAAVPLTQVAEDLAKMGPSALANVLGPLFSDVSDHLMRVRENTETNDNLLMALLMAATARQDLQQNADMRRISAWVAIAAVPTMIAGVYGMNFEHMPELSSQFGYPMVLLLMATICFSMYRAFKRSGWL